MFTLRCTQKVLKRLSGEPLAEDHPPTTVLGDWYANVLVCRPQHLVLCISERTLLPLVVPAKDPRGIPARIAEALPSLLADLGVETSAIEAESAAMREHGFGRTANRKVIGSLNELMFQLEICIQSYPGRDLSDYSRWLSTVRMGAIDYNEPGNATQALFLATQVVRGAMAGKT